MRKVGCEFGDLLPIKTLKAARYDSHNHTYALPRQELVENLNVLWATREICPESQPILKEEYAVSIAQIEREIQELSSIQDYSPRLKVDFTIWKAICHQENRRKQLYQQRLNRESAAASLLTQLSQWLQNTTVALEESWQALETIFDAPPMSFARQQKSETLYADAVPSMLRILKSSASEKERARAAFTLGSLGGDRQYPEAIEALANLLQETEDEETRTQAALSLGKLAPQHPLSGSQRAKLIDLGIQLNGYKIALVASVVPRPDGRIGVALEVKTLDPKRTLPANLTLSVLSASGETRLESIARSDEQGNGKDYAIGTRFSLKAGKTFKVQVSLGNARFTEELMA
jgi:hypothetical protein